MALDPKTKKLLNDFALTQPALNEVGAPAATSGVKLGDLIEEAGEATASPSAANVAVIAPEALDVSGADTVSQATLETRLELLASKINAVIAALITADLMDPPA